ncbi:caspase, EACC1-associated type [Nonomuraea sp. bgisy101]|uniref:caspase, EACC1-associated type n=1 Tax=Nonomuraea sp. bgisy101 TaxID=3413784 RepID=UPI003D702DB4
MTAGDFEGASALLLGTGTHAPGSDLPDLPAVARTLDDLREALLTRCGLASARVVLDPASPREMGDAIASAASAEGPLIVYYAGHGLVSRRGALHLAAAETVSRPLGLEHTALPYDLLRRYLLDNVEGPLVVVLDCCFSGRAIDGMSDPWDVAEISGAYVLTSAGRSEPSFAPEGLRHTAFSGALLRLLSAPPPVLTLAGLHRHLSRDLPAAGFPRPRVRTTGRAGELVLLRAPSAGHPPVRQAPAASFDGSPYKGLEAFGTADAALFFGRERLVETLVRRLDDPEPLIVTGASGSGKSSLLRAGLVPALKQRAAGTSIAVITPSEPVPPDVDVLVVDQFEEAFIAGTLPGFTGRVVLGVRADFLGRCAAVPELRAGLERGPVVVGPMSADELRAAVERPALAAGLTLEPGLVELLLRDLGTEPGRLPLLSHALLVTWQRRRGGTLTVAGYQAAGGIGGALAATADDVLASLPSPEAARAVFLRLVHVGEGTDDTRRRADLDRLLAEVPDALAACEVIDAFAADTARLITIDGVAVAITHEALLTAWPALRGWLDSDRTGLLVEQRVLESAAAWAGDDAGLYRGARLSLAREWAEGRPVGPAARAFLDASLALEEREILAARRRARRRVLLSAVLGVLLVLSVAAGGIALHLYGSAEAARRSATARALVLQANAQIQADPPAALRLALAALAVEPGERHEAALVGLLAGTSYGARLKGADQDLLGLAYSPAGRTVATVGLEGTAEVWDTSRPHAPVRLAALRGHAGNVRAAAFSPDGRTLVTGGDDGIVIVWRVSDWARTDTLEPGRGRVYALAFSPDGGRLALGAAEGALVWPVGGDRAEAVLETRKDDPVRSVAFTRDGRRVVTSTRFTDCTLWTPADGSAVRFSSPAPVEGEQAQVTWAIAVSPDGRSIATSGQRSRAYLWNIEGASPRLVADLAGHASAVNAVAFNGDGRLLATAGGDGRTIVWEVSEGAPVQRAVVGGRTGGITAAAFDPVTSDLVTTDSDGMTVLWETARLRPPAVLARLPQPDVGRGALAGDGGRLVTVTAEHAVTLWELGSGLTRAAALAEDAGEVSALAVDGTAVLVGREDGSAVMWKAGATPPDTPPAGRPVTRPPGARVTAAATTGGMAMVGAEDGSATLWPGPTSDPVPLPRGAGPAGSVDAVALSGDGRLAATGDAHGLVRLWTLEEPGRPVLAGSFAADPSGIVSAALSSDGRRLLTGGSAKLATLWDVSDPVRPVRLAGLANDGAVVSSVGFALGSAVAYTGAGGGPVSLWRLESSGQARRYATLPAADAVTLSADGRRMFAVGAETGAVVWDLASYAAVLRDPVAAACGISHGGFDEGEWTRLTGGLPYQRSCP